MKLICIGDSLTFGYGVRPSQRWTRLCAQETGWEIVNEGISGDTTGGMLVRLRALLEDRDICVQRPLVLLMGGANDIFFSGTDTGARANMVAMLNQLLSLGLHTMRGYRRRSARRTHRRRGRPWWISAVRNDSWSSIAHGCGALVNALVQSVSTSVRIFSTQTDG